MFFLARAKLTTFWARDFRFDLHLTRGHGSPEYKMPVHRKVKKKPNEQGNPEHRDRVVESKPVRENINTQGVQQKTQSRSHGVLRGLMIPPAIMSLKAPVAIQNEIGDRSHPSTDGGGEHVPNSQKFHEREQNHEIESGSNGRGNL
jgi:hypothetical protein